MNFVYKTISIDQIDPSDHLFSLYHKNPESLRSFNSSSLYSPIWLQEIKPNLFRIVDGFLIFQKLKTQTSNIQIPVQIFSQDMSLWEIWKLRIQKRKYEKNLSWVNVGESFYQCFNSQQYETELYSFLKQVNIPEPAKLQKVFFHFEKNKSIIKEFVLIYEIDYKEMLLLAKYNTAELQEIQSVFSTMNLTGNKLSSLLVLIEEIQKGRGLRVCEIVNVLKNLNLKKEIAIQHKYKKYKTTLMQLRYPRLSELKKTWEEQIKQLHLPKNVQIIQDQTFEKDDVTFEIQARNKEELDKTFNSMIENTKLEKMFELL